MIKTFNILSLTILRSPIVNIHIFWHGGRLRQTFFAMLVCLPPSAGYLGISPLYILLELVAAGRRIARQAAVICDQPA